MAETLQSRRNALASYTEETLRLPCHGIVIRDVGGHRQAIRSQMRRDFPTPAQFDEVLDYLEALKRIEALNDRVRALEALILAHHCAGLDVCTPAYCAGIDEAYRAICAI
jgi:hypothetical protein